MAKNKKGSDGRYRYRIYLGKADDGSKKFKSFYGSTEREARAAAEAYRTAIGKGMDPQQAEATLGTLYDNLIASKKAKGISQKSIDRLATNKAHWGELVDVPASDLRASDFQRVLNTLAGWHDGKPPLSHFTLTNLRGSAKAAYNLAIPEIVMYNPLIKTIAPAGAASESRDPITEAQQRWIRETPHTAQRAAMLLLYSGLRHHGQQGLRLPRQKGQDPQDACRRPRRQYPQGPRRLSPHPAGRLPLRAPQPQRPADD